MVKLAAIAFLLVALWGRAADADEQQPIEAGGVEAKTADAEQRELQAYFQQRYAEHLAQQPALEVGKTYRIRLRAGGTVSGRLESLTDDYVKLRTDYGSMAVRFSRMVPEDALLFLPKEAARRLALQDLKKETERRRAESRAAEENREEAPVSVASQLFGDPGPTPAQPSVVEVPVVDIPRAEDVVDADGPLVYDPKPGTTPDTLRPALKSFCDWLERQQRIVGGRIATRMYAKQQQREAVLYLVIDPLFAGQERDIRQRTAEGMQEFWGERCKAIGISSARAHLVLVDDRGHIVGGSRPNAPTDVWVKR
jgi:hypothetical protein